MSDKSDPIEPLFKYLRLACDLREIIKTTSISCVNANTKVIFVGTAWGDLYILDHEGNINSHRRFPKHIVGINRISVDNKGEFIATCSDDGQVSHLSFELIKKKMHHDSYSSFRFI
jgi:vacuolar protein sorting-associated protein 41